MGAHRIPVLDRRAALCLMIAGAAALTARTAFALPPPAAPTILTVTGAIGTSNTAPGGAPAAHFDRAMLEALPGRTMAGQTPWYDRPHAFHGPLLREVLAAAGATGLTLRIAAFDGYIVEIPFEDAERHEIILATRMDGREMSVRQNGPVRLLYPFDTEPELNNKIYFGRSIWQIETITVLSQPS